MGQSSDSGLEPMDPRRMYGDPGARADMFGALSGCVATEPREPVGTPPTLYELGWTDGLGRDLREPRRHRAGGRVWGEDVCECVYETEREFVYV